MEEPSSVTFPEAEALGVSVDQIEKIANTLADALSFDATKDDMHSLVNTLGCNIQLIDGNRDLDVKGTLEVSGSFNWSVYLPSGTGPIHDRFTLAHELGHFVLHARMGEKRIHAFRSFNSSNTAKPAEIEADQFAIAWLMPKESFLRIAAENENDIDVLSVNFGVLPETAKFRLSSLSSLRADN